MSLLPTGTHWPVKQWVSYFLFFVSMPANKKIRFKKVHLSGTLPVNDLAFLKQKIDVTVTVVLYGTMFIQF